MENRTRIKLKEVSGLQTEPTSCDEQAAYYQQEE